MPDVHQADFMPDFMSMSGVFDRAGEAMLPDMAEKLGVPVDLVPRMVQDTSMNYLFGADMGRSAPTPGAARSRSARSIPATSAPTAATPPGTSQATPPRATR